jgi:hypothetical protein
MWVFKRSGVLLLLILWSCLAASAAWTQEKADRELRPASHLSGTIIAPLESGKLILSSGDKVLVFLVEKMRVKTGDHLEIFQPLSTGKNDLPDPLFRRVGLAVLLEKIDERSMVCIIDHSAKEITVGDRVFLVPSR